MGSIYDIIWNILMEEILHQLVESRFSPIIYSFIVHSYQELLTGAGFLPSIISKNVDGFKIKVVETIKYCMG